MRKVVYKALFKDSFVILHYNHAISVVEFLNISETGKEVFDDNLRTL